MYVEGYLMVFKGLSFKFVMYCYILEIKFFYISQLVNGYWGQKMETENGNGLDVFLSYELLAS